MTGLEVYRSFLERGGIVMEAPPVGMMSRENLRAMFPEPEFRADVNRGVAPFTVRNQYLTTALNLYEQRILGPGMRLPMWVYGMTLDEQRRAGPLGPTIAEVLAFTQSVPATAPPRTTGGGKPRRSGGKGGGGKGGFSGGRRGGGRGR